MQSSENPIKVDNNMLKTNDRNVVNSLNENENEIKNDEETVYQNDSQQNSNDKKTLEQEFICFYEKHCQTNQIICFIILCCIEKYYIKYPSKMAYIRRSNPKTKLNLLQQLNIACI